MAVMELRLQILHIFDICVKYFVMSKNFWCCFQFSERPAILAEISQNGIQWRSRCLWWIWVPIFHAIRVQRRPAVYQWRQEEGSVPLIMWFPADDLNNKWNSRRRDGSVWAGVFDAVYSLHTMTAAADDESFIFFAFVLLLRNSVTCCWKRMMKVKARVTNLTPLQSQSQWDAAETGMDVVFEGRQVLWLLSVIWRRRLPPVWVCVVSKRSSSSSMLFSRWLESLLPFSCLFL
jgi:hypothetical protein